MEITHEVPICKLNIETDVTKYILHPVALGNVGQTNARQVLAAPAFPDKIALLVGPEGSFTDKEVAEALREGFVPLDLGKRILRTETACIAAAALLLTAAG